ncbi:uncharacterized protein C18orf63 [Caerostris darwini]|uniref:Uncharacterized protein C18orf63 n=1 Tax=Caerostris darwini TaxID=1538125 RepID=A0AAV4P6L3_9ARAC|nr:uncharacterized protein C18orf63 [Caerostris darwini]
MIFFKRKKLQSSEFQDVLRELGLDIVKIEETTTLVLQECLQYTSTAKMAPSWNILENILVQGPDFLTNIGPINAVKMDLFVSHQEIRLCLHPSCIKLPTMKIEHYANSEQLRTTSLINIEEKCHVLPSMKQGNVVAITKSPKTTGVFKDYLEIQKHWKDMYGYALPNVPEEYVWYFSVTFWNPNAPPYTYPFDSKLIL